MIERPFTLPFQLTEYTHHRTSETEKIMCRNWVVLQVLRKPLCPLGAHDIFSPLSFRFEWFIVYINRISFGIFFVLQANSRKRKPRGKKNKTVKPKVDEVVNSLSSAPPSEKSSEDEDDKEDKKVCIANLYSGSCFAFLSRIVF